MSRVLRRDTAKRDLAMQWAWYAAQGGIDLVRVIHGSRDVSSLLVGGFLDG